MGVDWAAIDMLFSLEFWRMAVWWTLSLLTSYFHLFLAKPLSAIFPSLCPSPPYPRRRFSPDPAAKIKRPICIITGVWVRPPHEPLLARAIMLFLCVDGITEVYFMYVSLPAGRCPQLLCQTIQEIKQQHRDACLNAFQVDLSSIHSIMNFESSIKQWLLDSDLHPSVQLLINNAGILAKSCRFTADGYDQMMETNYISAFVLTHLLLPLLKNSPVPSRIVNVTSFTHRCVSDVEVDRKNLTYLSTSEKYPFARVYEYSKFCLLLFSYELRRQLLAMEPSPNVSVNSADPGVVETSIMRELPRCLSQLAFTVLKFLCLLQSPEKGVGSIIDAALAPPEASGKYFFGGKGRTIRSSSLSYNTKLAEELWSTSHMLFQESVHLPGGMVKG